MAIISKIKLNDTAINQVKLNDIAVTQIEINNNIVYQIDKTELNNTLESYYQTYAAGQTSGLAGGPYTTATWTPFAEAYAAALQIRNSKYSNEETVSEAITNLDEKYNELEKAQEIVEIYSSTSFISIGYCKLRSTGALAEWIERHPDYKLGVDANGNPMPFVDKGMINFGSWPVPGTQVEIDRALVQYKLPKYVTNVNQIAKAELLFDPTNVWRKDNLKNARVFAFDSSTGIDISNGNPGDNLKATLFDSTNIYSSQSTVFEKNISTNINDNYFDITDTYKKAFVKKANNFLILAFRGKILNSVDEDFKQSSSSIKENPTCISCYPPKIVITFTEN